MSNSPKKNKRTVEGAGILLWKAGNAWQRHVRGQLKSFGITYVQYLLLHAVKQLEDESKQPSQTLVAKTAGVDMMMTSKVLRTLEDAKLVARKSDRNDARALVLQCTPTGKKKLTGATAALKKSEVEFFGKLSGKPHKFVENLETLAE